MRRGISGSWMVVFKGFRLVFGTIHTDGPYYLPNEVHFLIIFLAVVLLSADRIILPPLFLEHCQTTRVAVFVSLCVNPYLFWITAAPLSLPS